MFANPFSRTLARFGFHGRDHDEDRPPVVFAESEAPAVAPPPRIPPHQRHLYRDRDEALRGYSMGVYRPAASSLRAPMPEAPVSEAPVSEASMAKPARKAKAHRRGPASPATA